MTTIRTEHRVADTAEAQADLKKLATNLKKRRLQRGLSMQALAALVGCSHYVIAHVEQAQNFPSWPVYAKLVRVLKMGRMPLV